MPCIRLWFWLVWLVALVSPTLGHQVGGDSYLHMKITAGTAPYVLRHLDHPLIIVGGILIVLLGATYALWHVGKRTGRAWRWRHRMSLRLVRYGWCVALGLMALGLGVTYNAAQQEARLIVKGQEIAASPAKPLRHQLRIAEPRDLSYQTQLAAMQEAIAFLVERSRRHVITDRLAEILDQLAMGHTTMAQTLLKDQAEVSASRGDAATAALAERHRGTLALVANPEMALEAYSHAVDLDPQSWPGWISFASVLRHVGEHAKAESSAQRALELAQVTSGQRIRRGGNGRKPKACTATPCQSINDWRIRREWRSTILGISIGSRVR